jgi:hypothetical protein
MRDKLDSNSQRRSDLSSNCSQTPYMSINPFLSSLILILETALLNFSNEMMLNSLSINQQFPPLGLPRRLT